MRLFSVSADISHYLTLCETDQSISLRMPSSEADFLRGSKEDGWQAVDMTWAIAPGDIVMRSPDIAHYGLGQFAMPVSVAEQLRPHLMECVEFLPITFKGEPWFVMNVTRKESVLNETKSQRRIRKNGKPSQRWEKIVLMPESIKDGRVFYDPAIPILTLTTDKPDSLYSLVQVNNLTGLVFEEYQVSE